VIDSACGRSGFGNKRKGVRKVKRFRKRMAPLVGLLVALTLLLVPAGNVMAANPTVSMNVTAGIISINNTMSTWALGYATLDEVIYFSADGSQDDDYSLIGNTGNLAVDVEIQGTNFTGDPISWTLATGADKDQFALVADVGDAGTYSVEVKSSSYVDITTDLASMATIVWSMKFTAPDEFDATEAGDIKTATVTLVASEHT